MHCAAVNIILILLSVCFADFRRRRFAGRYVRLADGHGGRDVGSPPASTRPAVHQNRRLVARFLPAEDRRRQWRRTAVARGVHRPAAIARRLLRLADVPARRTAVRHPHRGPHVPRLRTFAVRHLAAARTPRPVGPHHGVIKKYYVIFPVTFYIIFPVTL